MSKDIADTLNALSDEMETAPLLQKQKKKKFGLTLPIPIKSYSLLDDENEIEDDGHHTQLADSGKRFIVVGLGGSCNIYQEFDHMWNFLSHSIKKKRTPEQTIWIDIQDPSAKDMKKIEKRFSLHPLTAEDIVSKDTGEKWEFFSKYLFIVLTAQTDKDPIHSTTQLNILIFDHYVLTVHDQPVVGLDMIMKRIGTDYEVQIMSNQQNINILPEQTSDVQYKYGTPTTLAMPTKLEIEQQVKDVQMIIPSPDWVLYAFIDAIVDLYIPVVTSILNEVENLDELLSHLKSTEQKEMLQRLGVANRNIVSLTRLLENKERIARLVAFKFDRFISEHVSVYMRDVIDHLEFCLDRLDISKDTLTHTHSTYLMRIQIEIARTSSRTGSVINRLSFYATVAAPPALLSGVFGMNIYTPGQDVKDVSWFMGILASMLLLAFIILAKTRKHRPIRVYR
ncbi:metal ion transporter [Acrasis kona]|uniref:Metal ion transporter n=1 Tax=Acrasis kona TaxID=1008807 RepID=A0AAW2ZFM0_9EUKA